MIGLVRGGRWLVIALLALLGLSGSVVWLRGQRQRAIAAWQSRLPLRVESTEGLLWPTRLNKLTIDASPRLSVGVARVELGFFPWQRGMRAHGVVLRGRAPLDTCWEEARRLSVPADLEVQDARIECTEAARGTFVADKVSFEREAGRDHLRVQSLHVLGTTFRDVHLWASHGNAVPEIRLAREAEDAKAPILNARRSPGQGVEWALDMPSQPFSQWANRIGLTTDATWTEAVLVGTGSLIVPDSPAIGERASFRFTIDDWHVPSWPEARLLTGRSGAVALHISPRPGTTHTITRVEVAAGLFSLVGQGELSLGEPRRLTFDAQGDLGCEALLAHLPPSDARERVQAYLQEHGGDASQRASVRLELSVRAEAPSAAPLRFRWHLRPGCGLSEMNED